MKKRSYKYLFTKEEIVLIKSMIETYSYKQIHNLYFKRINFQVFKQICHKRFKIKKPRVWDKAKVITKNCKNCNKEFITKKSKEYINNCSFKCGQESRYEKDPIKKFFMSKKGRLMSNSRKRGKLFNLSWKDLYNQYNKQNGLCFYTGIKLELIYSNTNSAKSNQLSVDRLNNTKGYNKNNIVLCCFCINNFKGSMNLKEFEYFLKVINSNNGEIFNATIKD